MFNKITDNEKITSKFPGFYRGIVVDNNDPLKSGRIKVRVYPMFSEVDDSALPWAIYADSNMGGYADVGSFKAPLVDSHVFVFFENQDHRFPVIFAGAPAIENDKPDIPELSRAAETTVTNINAAVETSIPKAAGGTWSEPQSAYAATYPNNKVYRSEKGIVYEIDDSDGAVRIHVYHPSGTREETDNSGNKVEHVSGNNYEVVIQDKNLYVKGNMDITVDGTCGINVIGNCDLKVGGNLDATVTGTSAVTSGGNIIVTSSGGGIDINAGGGNVTIDGSSDIILNGGSGKVVSTLSKCAFTGLNHPDGSSTCKVKQ